MFSHLQSLEHYCFKNIILAAHTAPSYQSCPQCEMLIGEMVATQSGLLLIGASCPDCQVPMAIHPAETLGDLHAELCISKFAHYPQWLREKKITGEEFAAWAATLTSKERSGFYEPSRPYRVVAKLTQEEIALREADPAQFKLTVLAQLCERAEHMLEHEIDHRKTSVHIDLSTDL